MAVAELVVPEQITAAQYLHMSFEHDAEFVEGRIVERAMPTWEHSMMQGFLIRELWRLGQAIGYIVVPEQRVQVTDEHFRVPYVCVVTEAPVGGIVTQPPYLCVEILSPEDSAAATLSKVRDYLHFGVAWVWVIDPLTLAGQVHGQTGVRNVEDQIFTTDRFSVDIADTNR